MTTVFKPSEMNTRGCESALMDKKQQACAALSHSPRHDIETVVSYGVSQWLSYEGLTRCGQMLLSPYKGANRNLQNRYRYGHAPGTHRVLASHDVRIDGGVVRKRLRLCAHSV